jgi:hypothetical protein
MKIYETISGNSLSFGILLPDDYIMANAKTISVTIGGRVFPHTVIDRMVRVELKSSDTNQMYGVKSLVVGIDDATLAVRKKILGDISFVKSSSNFSNQSVNEGYNFTVKLAINETMIEVTDVMYEYVKGERGGNTAFEIEDGDLILYLEQDGESVYEIEGNDLILNI